MADDADHTLFLWQWCPMCKAPYIECPKCKNNTCSAGFGEVDGKTCQVCNLAYQYAHLCYDNDLAPKTKKQIASFNKKIQKKNGAN